MSTQRIPLWDLPVRLFHWLLVIAIAAAVITANIGGNAMVWHGRIGLFIAGLIVFRLVWGLIGPTYARFSTFLPTPGSIGAYLRGQWRGIGHNPLGSLSVLGLLLMVAVQVGTGLFANDDIAFRGPLFDLVGKDTSDLLTRVHRIAINLLMTLIALHLAAIAFYAHVKKDNLVKPMIRGWKEIDPSAHDVRPIHGGSAAALIVALVLAVGAVYAASGAWVPPPPSPPAQQQAPAW